jgi:hypothetical protein
VLDPIRKGKLIDLYYDLKLGRPLMSFIERRGSIRLRYPLSGTFRYEPTGDGENIPSDLFVDCITNLKTVQGDLRSGDDISTVDADKIVTFEQGKTAEYHVVIDLRNPEASIADEKGEKAVALDGIVGSNLATHIRTVGLQYHLTGLSTETGGTTPESRLTPSRFLMTTVTSSSATERSALLMWIALQNLPFTGRLDATNSPLRFAPDLITQVSPIPKDKSASIYIAKDVIYSLVIKASFRFHADSPI